MSYVFWVFLLNIDSEFRPLRVTMKRPQRNSALIWSSARRNKLCFFYFVIYIRTANVIICSGLCRVHALCTSKYCSFGACRLVAWHQYLCYLLIIKKNSCIFISNIFIIKVYYTINLIIFIMLHNISILYIIFEKRNMFFFVTSAQHVRSMRILI